MSVIREISAGGVVIRKKDESWWMAAIELPAGAPATAPASEPASVPASAQPASAQPASAQPASTQNVRHRGRAKPKTVLCLPKGLIDPGEKPLDAALREVREETGVVAVPITKLGDSKYVYIRSWSDGERVFKIVSFYLLQYESGRIDNIADEMRIEVARARWVRLEEAPKLLAYRGEKQMARQALQYVESHAEL